jgi:hypothetical protein
MAKTFPGVTLRAEVRLSGQAIPRLDTGTLWNQCRLKKTHTRSLTVTASGPARPGEEEVKPDESEGCSPVSGGKTFRLCLSWPSDDPPTPLRSSVDTGTGDRGGAPAEFAVVAENVGCREDVGSVVLR